MFNLGDFQVTIFQDDESCLVERVVLRENGTELDVALKPDSQFYFRFNPLERQEVPLKTGLLTGIAIDGEYKMEFQYWAPNNIGGLGFRIFQYPKRDAFGQITEELVPFTTKGVNQIHVMMSGLLWTDDSRQEHEPYGPVRHWYFNIGQAERRERHRTPQARGTRHSPINLASSPPQGRVATPAAAGDSGIKRQRDDEEEDEHATKRQRARGSRTGGENANSNRQQQSKTLGCSNRRPSTAPSEPAGSMDQEIAKTTQGPSSSASSSQIIPPRAEPQPKKSIAALLAGIEKGQDENELSVGPPTSSAPIAPSSRTLWPAARGERNVRTGRVGQRPGIPWYLD